MRLIWLALACLAASSALAHERSRALLTLTVAHDRLDGRLEVSLRDLEDAVGVDANGDFAITWGELERRQPEIVLYALDRLRIGGDGAACALHAGELAVDVHGGASYAVLVFFAPACTAQARVTVDYALLFGIDPAHRALVSLDGDYAASGMLSADRPTLELLRTESSWASVRRFVAEGIVHIWQGYDHLAFLALLVLPAVLGRRGVSAARSWRPAALDIARIVTAFTAAHSLTLGLAVLGVIDVPVRAVEAIIAASVLIGAIMNLLPGAVRLGWRLAFGFGLVHGLGFANALRDLGVEGAGVFASLGGFNLGVELGQLAIVAAALPPLLALRAAPRCGGAVMIASSVGCAALACGWLLERL
jgi:HupE / UreJ protein